MSAQGGARPAVLRPVRRAWRGALRLAKLRPVRQLADDLVARGDAARAVGGHAVAAAFYEEALRLQPERSAIHVQAAHMLKELGDLLEAERHYLRARELRPDDGDLALQMGHFYKVAGRSDDALASYRLATELRPGWEEATREWDDLRRRAGSGVAHARELTPEIDEETAARLVPELFPRAAAEPGAGRRDEVRVYRLGSRRLRTRWGLSKTLRGVEAIRGHIVSSVPVTGLEIALDGEPIRQAALVEASLPEPTRRKWVFNEWIDFSGRPPGPCLVELRFARSDWGPRVWEERLVVVPPLSEAEHLGSDAILTLDPADPRTVDAQVNARPSVVRPAARALFPEPPGSVLVLRTDQLGDLVTSVPALRRLRVMLPAARIVGLLTSANIDLARTLGIFDEAIVVDFPDDPAERRRVMTPDAQDALRARLAPQRFDVALDLAESAVSRPLLQLSEAKFLFGFYDREWPWLDGGFECSTHDPQNGLEMTPQSTKLVAMIERLGTLWGLNGAVVVRRDELGRGLLADWGVGRGDRYVVLHDGARLAFSRWPGFAQLTARLIRDTDRKVVLLTDRDRADLPRSDRLLVVDRAMPFDAFDALLHHADAFVGNDSGPKHLAALRGTPVVSIHSARINWSEWGQELSGVVVSRKVPCAGCAIFHDSDECGRDIACIRLITADEVFAALRAYL